MNNRRTCKIPMEAIAAERGKKNKQNEFGVVTTGAKQDAGLGRHQGGTASYKQVTVNKKRPAGFQDAKQKDQGFLSLIFSDSA